MVKFKNKMKIMPSVLRKFEKCIVFLVTLFVLTTMAMPVSFAASNNNMIVQSMLQEDHQSEISLESGNVISLKSQTPTDKAFQVQETGSDGIVKITTKIPYVLSDDETLVNSFSYFENKPLSYVKASKITPNSIIAVPVNFTDVTVTTITYEAAYQNSNNFQCFYRHAGIEAKWSSDYPNTSVDYMNVIYNTKGGLYAYPDCINTYDPQCIDQSY